MIGLHLIGFVTLGLLTNSVSATDHQQTVPFEVQADLFDLSDASTLGLEIAPNVQSFTVFVAQKNANQYNHGAVLMPFKGKLYIQWQSSAKDEDAADTTILFSTSQDTEHWQAPITLVAARENAIVTNGGW